MRRKTSFVSPLLLILVGTLLLVRNFDPRFPFWEMVGRYWPLVLLIWGAAKLMEALRTPPGVAGRRPSLTVGEFFLALLIVMVGLSATKWVEVRGEIPWERMGIEWPWAQWHHFEDQKKHAAPAGAGLRVENAHGNVRIVGTEEQEIAINVSKSFRANSQEEARRLEDLVADDVEVFEEAGAVVVRVRNQPQFRADLEIQAPTKTAVTLELRRGDAHITNIAGAVSGEIGSGDAAVFDIAGDVRLRLRRGSLEARNVTGNVDLDGRGRDLSVADVTGHLVIRGDYSGALQYSNIAQGVRFNSSRTDLEIQKLPGRLEMTIGSLEIERPDGMVSVNTRNKDIRIEDFGEKVHVVNRGANVELRTSRLPLRDIEVENHSGPIDIAVPANANFQIEATARRGEVHSEFEDLKAQGDSDVQRIQGHVGGDSPATLKLNTTYGTIRLKKSNPETEHAAPAGRPEPPTAPQTPEKSPAAGAV